MNRLSKKLTFVLCAAAMLVAAAGCSSSKGSSANAKKGSDAKGAAAKTAGQTTGGTATSNVSSATDKGTSYEDATCDADLEGTAWCDDDTTVIFCSGGNWYALDCAQIGGDLCAETIDAHVVDCDAPSDVQ
jgi:hypothetical protein